MGYNDMKTAGYGNYMFENGRKRNGQIEGRGNRLEMFKDL
jgi:hypothetical protein